MTVRCVDCRAEGVTASRPIVSGKRKERCATHTRALKQARKAAAHERYVGITYNLPPGMYKKLYDAQGGLCYICGPRTGAKGKNKKLTVDHDHKCCPGPISCGKCVRGLTCGKCNDIIGYYRDDPECFLRGAQYLYDPPARLVFAV